MPTQSLYPRYPGYCTDVCRVVRMFAKANFLQEPQPGFVAHAAISAGFVPNSSHSDAVVESIGPVALHMPPHRPVRHGTTYSITLTADQTLC